MSIEPLVPIVALAITVVAIVAAAALLAERTGQWRPWLRRALIGLGLVVIALRPGGSSGEAAGRAADLDVYVLLDRTASMVAEDHDGNRPRLDGVRTDLRALAGELVGARFAVIGFDNNVVDLMPLTDDLDALNSTVELLTPEPTLYSTGSSPRLPVEEVRRRLVAAREREPGRARVIVYVSDGEATADEPATDSFDALDGLVDGGVVLGYGTAEGGPMRERLDPTAIGSEYLLDPATGRPAISRVDEDTLQAIAAELDVPYVRRDAGGGLNGIADTLADASDGEAAAGRLTARQDLTWLLALPVLGLVLVEVSLVGVLVARLAPRRSLAISGGRR